MALEALQIPYQVKLWQFGDAANGLKGPQFTKINPNGRVPALEDPNTGIVSWESMACMNYILRNYDSSNSLGPADNEKARVDYDIWTAFLLSTIGPMMGQVNWFRHYHQPKNEDALKRYEAQAYHTYDVLEGQLKASGGKFVLGGERCTAVDYHVYSWLYQHGFAQLGLEKYPNIKKWLDGFAQRPEVKKAYEKVPAGEEIKA